MDRNGFHTVRGYQLLEENKNLLTSGMEDYLEMILRNSLKERYIRINKLAGLLNVTASSASRMVQKLGKLGLLYYEKYGIITLTQSGKEIGEYLLNRHNIVEKFLTIVGIQENLLLETEFIEHNISTPTLKNIEMLNIFFEQKPEILDMFKKFKEVYR